MPIIAETKQSAKAPEGAHQAVCYGMYDIGTQPGNLYGPKHQVVILFELPHEHMDDGRPFTIRETLNLTMNSKGNLRKRVDAWRGKPLTDAEATKFDITQLVGKGCQLQIAHRDSNGKIYANITSLMAMPKGMPTPKTANELRCYSLTDPEIPPNTPNWILEKIAHCEEKTDSPDRFAEPVRPSAPSGAKGFGVPVHAATSGDDVEFSVPVNNMGSSDDTPF